MLGGKNCVKDCSRMAGGGGGGGGGKTSGDCKAYFSILEEKL